MQYHQRTECNIICNCRRNAGSRLAKAASGRASLTNKRKSASCFCMWIYEVVRNERQKVARRRHDGCIFSNCTRTPLVGFDFRFALGEEVDASCQSGNLHGADARACITRRCPRRHRRTQIKWVTHARPIKCIESAFTTFYPYLFRLSIPSTSSHLASTRYRHTRASSRFCKSLAATSNVFLIVLTHIPHLSWFLLLL